MLDELMTNPRAVLVRGVGGDRVGTRLKGASGYFAKSVCMYTGT